MTFSVTLPWWAALALSAVALGLAMGTVFAIGLLIETLICEKGAER